MSIVECIRRAKCKDCKYCEVRIFNDFPYKRSWCNLKHKETKQKNTVCDDWKY